MCASRCVRGTPVALGAWCTTGVGTCAEQQAQYKQLCTSSDRGCVEGQECHVCRQQTAQPLAQLHSRLPACRCMLSRLAQLSAVLVSITIPPQHHHCADTLAWPVCVCVAAAAGGQGCWCVAAGSVQGQEGEASLLSSELLSAELPSCQHATRAQTGAAAAAHRPWTCSCSCCCRVCYVVQLSQACTGRSTTHGQRGVTRRLGGLLL